MSYQAPSRSKKKNDDVILMKQRYEKQIESLSNKVSVLQSQLNAKQREVDKVAAENSQPKKSRLRLLRDVVEKGGLDDIPF